MNTSDLALIQDFANREIVKFHEARLRRLDRISLDDVLKRKNPYLFRARNLITASELVSAILGAYLSSSEEECFGQFLESLAIYVSSLACDGRKSVAQGIDLEFDRDGTLYLVAIKSGPNWGNSSQIRRLEDDMKQAIRIYRQRRPAAAVQAVLGICYGRQRAAEKVVYRRIVGQEFWYFLSGDAELYLDIIEPIGTDARRHNDDFARSLAAIQNRFTHQFIERFCHVDYSVDWAKLVEFNSGNLGTGTTCV